RLHGGGDELAGTVASLVLVNGHPASSPYVDGSPRAAPPRERALPATVPREDAVRLVNRSLSARQRGCDRWTLVSHPHAPGWRPRGSPAGRRDPPGCAPTPAPRRPG